MFNERTSANDFVENLGKLVDVNQREEVATSVEDRSIAQAAPSVEEEEIKHLLFMSIEDASVDHQRF